MLRSRTVSQYIIALNKDIPQPFKKLEAAHLFGKYT